MDFFSTTISPKAIELVNETLKSGKISAGAKAELFEKKLKEKFKFKNIATLNSGTSALHLALNLLNLKEGDEVILPAQTFIATGLAVLYEKAKPVFADINVTDGNISIQSIKEKITDRTKAILCVDWAGQPCDIDEIRKIIGDRDIKIITDAAHSIGSVYKLNYTGNIADITCFSFQSIKHLPVGDGGAIVCNNEEYANEIKKLRWFYIDRDNDKTGFLGEREYNATKIGFKYHMNDIVASMGIGNLEVLDEKLHKIRMVANAYNEELKDVKGLVQMSYNENASSSYWLYPVLVENRDDFINKMISYRIPVSVVHLGIDKNDIFGGIDDSLINQRFFDRFQIHLPIHDKLTYTNIEKIINTIKSGW